MTLGMARLMRGFAPAYMALALAPLAALAADQTAGAPCPSTITSGSESVVVEGKAAARAGDTTGCGGPVVAGSPDVFINGKPMARVGDAAGCLGK